MLNLTKYKEEVERASEESGRKSGRLDKKKDKEMLVLKDFMGNEKEFNFELNNLKDVEAITLDLISGDEVVTVYYKFSGWKRVFNPSGDRLIDFVDLSRDIYRPDENINLIEEF